MRYLDTDTVAEDLGLNTRTIQKYCKAGFLPAIKQRSKGKAVYLIEQIEYYAWKTKHFKGISGKLSRFRSQERDLSKSEIRGLIAEWLEWCATGKLGGKPISPRTVEIYDYYFNYYLTRLGRGPKLPIASVDNFRKVLGTIPIESFSTRRHVYDAVMSFTKYLIETNKFKLEEREKLRKLRPRRFLPAKRPVLNENQLEKVIKAVESYKMYHKYSKSLNLTLIHFIANSGLRAGEVCNLKLKDIDLEAGIIHVWLGKGNKNRKVGISQALKLILQNYLDQKPKTDSEYFFINQYGGKLDRDFLSQRFTRISKRTGIDITAHALRRTFVTLNVNRGKPLVHLQIACGHSDISTTRSYCMTTEDEVIEAMKGW